MERYRSWFGVAFEFLLYVVTSTFFEGQAEKNEKAARGYPRDSRPDCKQVCIGLVCTPEGLPLSYEVFAGNRTDVTTVEEIDSPRRARPSGCLRQSVSLRSAVRTMEEKYGQARRVWVMDRGMVSEKNIAFLRACGARYLVGTPKSQLRQFEAALLEKEGWSEVQSGLEAKLVAHPDGAGDEQFILCRSSARGQKEAAMLARQSDALCEELAKIDRALTQKPQADLEAVGRRIGRWQGRYPAAAKVLDIVVRHDAEGRACGLTLSCPLAPGRWAAHTQPTFYAPTAPSATPRNSGAGISSSPRPKPRSAPPKATSACAPSTTRPPRESKRTSSSASWRWRCGALWRCGCTAKASAPAPAAWSKRWRRSKAWTWRCPCAAASRWRNCACAASRGPSAGWPNCSCTWAWTCPPAAGSSKTSPPPPWKM